MLGILLLIAIPLYFLAKKEKEVNIRFYSMGKEEGYKIGFEEGISKEYKDGYNEGFDNGFEKAKIEFKSDYY